ncbi:MAG: hypothetical protein PHH77_07815 [Victivallaceae bacterium]|nr:hypothetical protein [Victivallaceae bacterium]
MNILKLLILVFLCGWSLKSPGATIPFRLGEILSAEISRNKVTVRNLDKYDYAFKFRHYAYAVVAVRLHPGRSLGIYDFQLKFKGKVYKCVALQINGGYFDADRWQMLNTNPETIYSLLFILDSEVFGNAKKTLSATLVYVLNNSGQTDYPLPFKFINYDPLTAAEAIPKNGIFQKIKVDTRRKVTGSSFK